MADAVPGEHAAFFWAGAIALASALVAVAAVWAVHKDKPYAWNLGFFSVALGSTGTALGLWKLAGDSGWSFLAVAVLMAAGAIGGAVTWGRKRPIAPLQDTDVKNQEQNEAEGKHGVPRPK